MSDDPEPPDWPVSLLLILIAVTGAILLFIINHVAEAYIH